MDVESGSILGVSPAIVALRDQIRRLAAFDTVGSVHVPTVLLRGETGTGKGLVARSMHASGPRHGGPFIDVSCGAIPESMLEAELFGFEAGAFTDARRAKPGLFEAAAGGTLFLDEVDALTPLLQAKLLKAIEEKTIRRLGAVATQRVDAKLIAATQANLEELVAAGAFRADLYHRLAVFILVVPPLRDRPDDVALLADHYLTRFATAHGLPPRTLGGDALRWLNEHTWPGNVRELGHLMERVALIAPEGEVDATILSDLAVPHVAPASFAVAQRAAAVGAAPSRSGSERAGLDDLEFTAGSVDAAAQASGAARQPARGTQSASVEDGSAGERERITAAIALTGGNVVAAARVLGLGRNALRYRMRRLGIDRPELELSPSRAPARDGEARDPLTAVSADAALPRSPIDAVSSRPQATAGRRSMEGMRSGLDRSQAARAAPKRADVAPPRAGVRSQTWEQKAVVALGCEVTLPVGAAEEGLAPYEPWTVAMRVEQSIEEKLTGFGGTIIDRAPTRVLALFGAPRALERGPERAVQAALAIRRLPGVSPDSTTRSGEAHGASAATTAGVEIRLAAHLGTVRVDTSAPPEQIRESLLPLGDTLSLPQRLLGHAGPGEILLSLALARRVESEYELHSRDLQAGPHAADRMTAFSVVRVAPRAARRDQVEPSFEPAVRARFVGREHEVGLLEQAFSRARAGRGQVVLVAGEAGIGKSRLLLELGNRIAEEPHVWIEGRCAAYGGATAFLPIADGLRRTFAIDDRDDEAAAAAKVAAGIRALGTGLDWTIPLVHRVLSIAADDAHTAQLDSASRRSETFRALLELLRTATQRQPLVLVVEDLHWVDPASEELLAFLADAVPSARLLLVCSFRSGYSHPFGDRSYHVRVTLGPLSGDEMATMNESLLGVADVPEGVRTLIARKAEGNPFFVEELTKSLIEDGALLRAEGRVRLARSLAEVEMSVPGTIQELLSARLDRLDDEARRAIQVASVIGREFALRLLERISEVGEQVRLQVEELRALELIYEKALHPELAYMFKHALTHEVAYQSVLGERRRELHRTIGAAIESLYGERLAEHYEALAHHFGQAEDWQRALRYHERAADKAAASYANHAVVEHCRQGLAILDRMEQRDAGDPESASSESRRKARCRLEDRLAIALFYLSDFVAAAQAFERAAHVTSDPEASSLRLSSASFAFVWGHRYDDCRRTNAAAHESAGHGRFAGAEAACLVVDGFLCGVLDGDVEGEARLAEEARRMAAASGHEDVEAKACCALARAAEWRGDYAGAVAAAERAIEIARRMRMGDLIVWSTWFLGKARCCAGDFGAAMAELQEAYDLCDRLGDRAWRARLLNTLGWCFAELGSPGRARNYNQRAAVLAREIGDPELLANAEINLAVNAFDLGEIDSAVGHIEPIEASLDRPGDPWMRWRYALHARDLRARIELSRGRPDIALALVDEEIAGAKRHRAPKLEARALVLRGETLRVLERRDQAVEAIRAAARIAEGIGYSRAAWEAHGIIATALREAGQVEEARAHAGRQAELVQSAARSIRDAELGRGLLRLAATQ